MVRRTIGRLILVGGLAVGLGIGGAEAAPGLVGRLGITPGVVGGFLGVDNTNRVTDNYGVVTGGRNNQAGDNDADLTDASYAFVGGGFGNTASSLYATVSGGWLSTASGHSSTVGGGQSNLASGGFSTVAGGKSNVASGTNAAVGGGLTNTASAINSTVGGGTTNIASGDYSTLAGGRLNVVQGHYTAVGGGISNRAAADFATIAGGGRSNLNVAATGNRVTDAYGTIGGGGDNQAGDAAGTTTDRIYATVAGGGSNAARGSYSSVPGGQLNAAAGDYSLAAGRRAKALHAGSSVWGDATNADIASTGVNQFIVRAAGGIWLGTNSTVNIPAGRFLQTSTGAYLSSGGVWTNNSDRALKDNLQAVDGGAVLAGLVGLPMYTWQYSAEGPSVRHIGPTAQDFAAAFGVGANNTHIATVDADGVALAAIQGLHQLVQEKDAEIVALRTEMATKDAAHESELTALTERVAAIEAGGAGQTPAGSGLFGSWAGVALALAGVAGLGVTAGRRLR